jgi:hypothetical protein
MSLSKQQRKALYDFLSSTGYVFNRERHKMLKKLLTQKAEEQSPEPELLLDNNPQIIGPAEDEEE